MTADHVDTVAAWAAEVAAGAPPMSAAQAAEVARILRGGALT